MRVIEFSDGFTSSSAPTSGSVQQNSLASYATDAAYVTGKGSAAAEGDAYYNTTYDLVRVYQNSAWRFLVGQKPSFATPAAYVTAKGSAAENGDTFYESTEAAPKMYQGGAWHFLKTAVMMTYATVAAFVTGKGSAAAAGDLFYHSGLAAFMGYQGSAWAQLLSADQGTANAQVINGKLSWSVAANALTVALKTKAGSDPSANDPVFIAFRTTTVTDSVWVVRKVEAALSVVVSSGSTLGHTSAVNQPIYAYFIDNAGTVELGVISVTLDDSQLCDSTAEGGAGAADSPHLLYSTTARTGKAICFAGRAISSQATAGTWATAMALVSGVRPSQHDYSVLNFNWSVVTNPTSTVDTSPSEGVKTITLPQVGLYQVNAKHQMEHGAPHAYAVTRWTIAGTATRRDTMREMHGNGDASSDSNDSGVGEAMLEATAAGQTITIVPVFNVSYGSTPHNAYSGYTVERIR